MPPQTLIRSALRNILCGGGGCKAEFKTCLNETLRAIYLINQFLLFVVIWFNWPLVELGIVFQFYFNSSWFLPHLILSYLFFCSSGMTCPASDFVEESFLLTAKNSLSEQGLFIVNLVSRSSAIKDLVISRMKVVSDPLIH